MTAGGPHVGLIGAVLAGGESRRFGSDKAAAHLGGETLVSRAAATLGRVFDEVVIVSSRPPATDLWPHLPDTRERLGPLGGIEAALLHARDLGRDGAFVLACDMPLVDERVVRAIVAALGEGSAAAPAPNGGPHVEPLCAAYRIECLPALARALDERRLAAHELFATVGGRTIGLPEGSFLNVNTPEDHARAGAVLRREAR